jgi:tetratricopeptide (TPR) repeat protein
LAVVGAIIVRNDRERARAPEADVDPTSRLPAEIKRYGPLALRLLLVVAMVVPFLGWLRVDPAHNDFYVGADAYNRGDVEASIAHLQDAVDEDSSVMVYRMLLGIAQARRFNETGRSDRALIDAAVVNLEQAAKIDKRSDIARANLAQAYALAGDRERAAEQAQITRLAVNHVAPVIAAAEVYELIEDDANAVDAYGQVISMDAGLADSAFWDGSEWRSAHYEDIVDASILALNPCTYGSHIVQVRRHEPAFGEGELEEAEQGCQLLVLSAPNDLTIRVALARIQMELGKMEAARGHLGVAVDRQPDFGPARLELGRWFATSGDIESARHEWVLASDLEQAEAVMLLGDSYRPQDRPADLDDRLEELLATTGSSVQNDLISILYYRARWGRMSPVLAMIPGDWQTATPRLYDDMQATLERWRSE